MEKYNRVCLLCKTHYRFCNSCSEFRKMPEWKNTFDEENCLTIFQTVSDYLQKVISKEKAKSILVNCDLSRKDTFKDSIHNAIIDIMDEKEELKMITPVLDGTEGTSDMPASNTDEVVTKVENNSVPYGKNNYKKNRDK